MKRLLGKVAVVTGAGGQIGRAEALAFAREGANVVVNDVADASETIAALREFDVETLSSTHDISTWGGGAGLIEAAVGRFGKIDILVNNAGTVAPLPIQEMTEAAWDKVVNVSLKGYAATIRAAAPHFIAQRSGVIVNTGSTSGLGHLHMANYSAAKEGALGLTRTVARELGLYGVRCNLIRPVSMQTNLLSPELHDTVKASAQLDIPLNGRRHMGWTSDRVQPSNAHVAALVVLLSTSAAASVSGQDFYICGDEIGRIDEPIPAYLQFRPEGWTIDALESPPVLSNLFGDLRDIYVRR